MVRVVVLNYNGGAMVLDAVASLMRLDWPADRLDLVVVDNASSDGSDADIEHRFPSVRVIRSPDNVGFSGNNLALRNLEDTDYVGLVNNDATVEPGWLRALVDTLEADPGVGAACPRILLSPSFSTVTITAPTERLRRDRRDLGVRVSGMRVGERDVWRSTRFGTGVYPTEAGRGEETEHRWTAATAVVHVPVPAGGPHPTEVFLRLASTTPSTVTLAGGDRSVDVAVGPRPRWVPAPLGPATYDLINNVGSVITDEGFGADRGFLEPDVGQYDEPTDVAAWCGAGVLLRSAFVADVGPFDERFFVYYEDTDLSWRGRARGWRYRYAPEAVQRHVHAASTVEGSPLFRFHVERNRLLMLAKNATWRRTARAAARFVLDTATVARSEILAPVLQVRRPRPAGFLLRVRSLLAFARLVPAVVVERRRSRHDRKPRAVPVVSTAVHR
jgi:GT2 family glycosyltransferase